MGGQNLDDILAGAPSSSTAPPGTGRGQLMPQFNLPQSMPVMRGPVTPPHRMGSDLDALMASISQGVARQPFTYPSPYGNRKPGVMGLSGTPKPVASATPKPKAKPKKTARAANKLSSGSGPSMPSSQSDPGFVYDPSIHPGPGPWDPWGIQGGR